MEYRILGRTGIKVSAVGLGGEGFEGKNKEDTKVIVDKAMAGGSTLLTSIIPIQK